MKTHFTGWPTWYWEYCVVGSVCWYRYGYWYWHLNLQPRTNQEVVRVSFHFCEKKIRRRISVDWWNKTTVNTVHIVNPGFLYIYWVPGTVCIIERFMIHDIYSIIAAVHKLSEINIYIKTSQCGLCLFHHLLQTPGNTGRLASLQTCKKKIWNEEDQRFPRLKVNNRTDVDCSERGCFWSNIFGRWKGVFFFSPLVV